MSPSWIGASGEQLVAGAGAGTPSADWILSVALVAGLLVVTSAVAIPIGLWARRRHIVENRSAALQELVRLNDAYADTTRPLSAIYLRPHISARSKAHLERLDLRSLFLIAVQENERELTNEVSERLRRLDQYEQYLQQLNDIGRRLLGKSSDTRISDVRFKALETKLFRRWALAKPTPDAQIRVTASYVSPKGQNTYTRSQSWGWSDLRAALIEVHDTRLRKATAQVQRQRERALMTPSLRIDVLRRDNYRCQKCGATASTGATLHIDHIVPVSRGGRTYIGNLQTLCDMCNLGKSNRFIG